MRSLRMRRMASSWMLGSAVALPPLLFTCATARASGHVWDDALVQKPLIVVALCPSPSAERHDLIENNAVLQAEGHTEVVVERVIKGDIRPGRYKLLYGWGVDWPEDEGLPADHTSSNRLGEVEDISQPNLWFLLRKRSWDKADPTVYLSLDTYRGVQPLALEPYFAALQSDDRQRKVRELLHSKDQTVSSRSSAYLSRASASSSQTWHCMNADPQAFHRMLDWYTMAMVAKKFGIQRVRNLLNASDPGMRRMAAISLIQRGETRSTQPLLTDNDPGVRAEVARELIQHGEIPSVRPLLNDKVPAVRESVALLLMQRHDGPSVLHIGALMARMPRSRFDCAMVDELVRWGDRGLVPALIACLQTDSFEGWETDGVRIPALKARAALQQITGYVFPFDVRSSQRAWTKARQFPDAAARLRSLVGSLGEDPNPLRATAVEDRGQAAIELTNKSRQPIVLARHPTEIEVDWGRGSGIRRPEPVASEPSFVHLKPGESMRFLVPVYSVFLAADPPTRQITFLYPHNGNEFGVNAWIGLLRASWARSSLRPKRRAGGSRTRRPGSRLPPLDPSPTTLAR
jgi:HEAT repeat protein